MKKKYWPWILLIFLLLLIVFFGWSKYRNINAPVDILSKQDARELIQVRYEGTVKQIALVGQHYHIDLEKNDSLYKIKLDALEGKVISFSKTESTKTPPANSEPVTFLTEDEIKKIILAVANGTITLLAKTESNGKTIYKAVVKETNKQTTLTVDAITGKILSTTPIIINETSKRLTEAEAKVIAKKQVNGAVEHIWLEKKGSQTYYLVEIETQDDREAIVQIHAITGNVMSVSWDDHGKDDDKEDDDSKDRSKDDNNDDDD
jgi:uncharacterized membrane protein YkoI